MPYVSDAPSEDHILPLLPFVHDFHSEHFITHVTILLFLLRLILLRKSLRGNKPVMVHDLVILGVISQAKVEEIYFHKIYQIVYQSPIYMISCVVTVIF